MGREPPPLQGVPVMVVEDDVANARLLCFLLNEAGGEVRVAHTAEEALEILKNFHPCLLTLDLVLPRMNGLLLVHHLKANPLTRDIVVIAVTSMSGPRVEGMVLQAGCAGYLHKPVDVETFAETVACYLGE